MRLCRSMGYRTSLVSVLCSSAAKLCVCYGVYHVIIWTPWFYVLCACALCIVGGAIRRLTTGHIRAAGEGVIITGCDTGFGNDVARRLDSLGFTVFAGCLHPSGPGARSLKSSSSRRLHVVPMDVGSDDSVSQAERYVLQHLPEHGLWGIINNAGFNVMGDVEWCPVGLYHKAVNVNLYGAIRTIRHFLHMVRQTKGRVVVVSSVRGLISWPADSAYHVTKYGLETLSDSLRMEMTKFGVRVAVVEPGNYSLATACQNEEHFKRYKAEADEMWEAASENVRTTYGREYLDAMLKAQFGATAAAKGVFRSADSTDDVVDAMVDALTSHRPRTRYLVDGGASAIISPGPTIARYNCFLPTWLTDYIIVKWTKCDRLPNPGSAKRD